MDAYDPELWHEFFVMIGGASAALAGLLFVAISFNHEQILATRALPSMAARSLLILLSVVVLSALGLALQPPLAFGVETLVLGVFLVTVTTVTTVRTFGPDDLAAWRIERLLLAAVASVPMVGAGLSIVSGIGGGMFWVLGECIAAIAVGTYSAWILLIEIRR